MFPVGALRRFIRFIDQHSYMLLLGKWNRFQRAKETIFINSFYGACHSVFYSAVSTRMLSNPILIPATQRRIQEKIGKAALALASRLRRLRDGGNSGFASLSINRLRSVNSRLLNLIWLT
jgi:hypothetical protein